MFLTSLRLSIKFKVTLARLSREYQRAESRWLSLNNSSGNFGDSTLEEIDEAYLDMSHKRFLRDKWSDDYYSTRGRELGIDVSDIAYMRPFGMGDQGPDDQYFLVMQGHSKAKLLRDIRKIDRETIEFYAKVILPAFALIVSLLSLMFSMRRPIPQPIIIHETVTGPPVTAPSQPTPSSSTLPSDMRMAEPNKVTNESPKSDAAHR